MAARPKRQKLEEAAPVIVPADAQLYLDHLQKINDVFYDQIKIADQKAAYIFTFMAAFLVSSVEGRAVFTLNRYQTSDPLTIVLSALLAVMVIASLVSSTLVVLPRHLKTSATSLYWGTWSASRDLLLAAHDKDDPEFLFREYLGNADNLAAINQLKYRYVSLSFRTLIATIVCYVLLLGTGGAVTGS